MIGKFILLLHIISLLIASAMDSSGQYRQVKFNLTSGTNGISIGKINGMTKDKRGFMWFSDQTNRCIVRFDGSHMTKFIYDPNDSTSLGGYYPECLAADSSGNIWIGFFGAGLDKYNPETNEFTHYRKRKDDPNSLSSDSVSSICIDHLKNIWVGTQGGLDLLDVNTGKFKRYHHIPDDKNSLSHNVVRGIYEDKNGDMWIGTGFTWDPDGEGGLNKFNRTDGSFIHYKANRDGNGLIDNKVRAMLEDSYGNFWIGTRQNGLHLLNRKTGQITKIPYLPATLDGLGVPPIESYDDNITFIVEDAERKIWIGTMLRGVIRYDPERKEMMHFSDQKSQRDFAFQDSTSWWAHATPEGLVWISTQNANLYRVDVQNLILPSFQIISDNGACSIAEENSDEIWYGTTRGLLLKNDKTGVEKRFVHNPRDSNSISHDVIFSLLKDSKGNLWVGTNNALNFFDRKTGKFKRYYHQGSDILTITTALLEDDDGNIWMGTFGNGLFMFNSVSEKFDAYHTNSVNGNTISSDAVQSIVIGKQNKLWIATGRNGGVDNLDRKTGKIIHYMPGMSVYCLYKDHAGEIWAGTPVGAFRYDEKKDRFIALTEEHPSLSVVEVESIIEDNELNLWMGTEVGLFRINKTRDQLVRYGRANGLFEANNAFLPGVAIRRKDGQLQLGYYAGYYAFYPDKLKPRPSDKRLFFTGLWLNNTLATVNDRSILKSVIDSTTEISLKHHQNIFAITATCIDFQSDGDKRIFYKLENYDNDWRSVNPEEQMQYFKVPPGKYIFHIRTSGAGDGQQLEKSIVINISSPWWQTWWAFSFYIILFIGFVFLIHRYQKNKVIAAERERTRTEQLEQAKEIEKAYHELRSTQAQLIQSEKMASLGELTAGIAHEIQNPLNFVNNFSDINRDLMTELKEEIQKGNLSAANSIADDIINNEQKISHHGQRADAIVKGMLQHSRNSNGEKEATDINALAEEYFRLAFHGLRSKDKSFNATMKTDIDPAVGIVKVIPQEIGRVLLNLYGNAFYAVNEKMKHRISGYEPVVELKTKKLDKNIFITVKDNGIGIPGKIVEKIFQPFFTTKPTGQGTGLGLSLAYDIIKAHGGEILVDSEPGVGSEFRIVIPVS